MGNGLKMFKAKDKYTGLITFIKDVDVENPSKYICKKCAVDVKYTKPYTKQSSNTRVDAYFSLYPNTSHKNSCDYNIKNAITKLVNSSTSIEDTKSSIFENNEEVTIFRLNFLQNAFYQELNLLNESRNEKDIDTTSKVGIKYKLTSKQIASYFRSAMGVSKIKSLVELDNTKEFESLLKIEYKNKIIEWRNFYFERNNYPRLYKKSPEYPIAVKVYIEKSEIKKSETAPKFKWSIRVKGTAKKEKDISINYSLFIRFNDEIIAKDISSSSSYILLGRVYCNKETNIENVIYRSLNINIFNLMQIKKVM